MRCASSTMIRSQWTWRRPGRISDRLARSSEVTSCFCSSHWLTPNWSRMSSPLMTKNFSSNFSLSSRCHWNARFAGAGVVGQEEADAGELQQVVVDRFQLVRQGINPRNGQAEVGVELVGNPE